MKIFAASDHHFMHRNIIKYTNRPFDYNDPNCVRDCAKTMILKHNEIVSDDDIVLIIGDLSASLKGRTDLLKQIIGKMNGNKILLRGNHDHLSDEFYKDAGFLSVIGHIYIEPYFICHYPCLETNYNKKPEKNYISILKNLNIKTIIHGHIHNKKPLEDDGYKRINVSIDYEPNDFYPIELKQPEIVEFFKKFKK